MSAVAEMAARLAELGATPEMIKVAVAACNDLSVEFRGMSTENPRNRDGRTPDQVLADRRARDRLRKQTKKQTQNSAEGKVSASSSLSSSPECSSEKELEASGSERARRKSGATLPEDWQPSADERRYGREIVGLFDAEIDACAEDMRLWAHGNSNRAVARKANWSKTFQGWMRREAPKLLRARGPPGAGPNVMPLFSTTTGPQRHDQRFATDRRSGNGFARNRIDFARERAAAAGTDHEAEPTAPRVPARDGS